MVMWDFIMSLNVASMCCVNFSVFNVPRNKLTLGFILRDKRLQGRWVIILWILCKIVTLLPQKPRFNKTIKTYILKILFFPHCDRYFFSKNPAGTFRRVWRDGLDHALVLQRPGVGFCYSYQAAPAVTPAPGESQALLLSRSLVFKCADTTTTIPLHICMEFELN